jgi:hypothetical protein
MAFCLFLANILLLNLMGFSNLYYFFSWQGHISKVIWCLYVSVFGLLVLTSTIIWLGSLRKFFRILIILDNIVVVFFVTLIGFFGLIGIIDNGEWPYLIMRIGYIIQSLSRNSLFKLLVLYMKWSKTRLIVYKLILLLNCGLLVALSAYFFSVNFSSTRYYLPSLDEKLQDFVMIYLFGIFAYQY